jgi:membrane protein YdbS with pleckstrin-like domain
MKIATSRIREQFPLSKKKIIKQTIGDIVGSTLFYCFIYLIISTVVPENLGKPIEIPKVFIVGFLLVSYVGSYLYRWRYWAVYFYDLTPDSVVIRKNPITPTEIIVPYERIQDIYVDQDLLDRILGLYDVHLSSATLTSAAMAHIDGVTREGAEGLRAILLEKVRERIKQRKESNLT